MQHDSDCAVYNAPALPVGSCDCSVRELSETYWRGLLAGMVIGGSVMLLSIVLSVGQ